MEQHNAHLICLDPPAGIQRDWFRTASKAIVLLCGALMAVLILSSLTPGPETPDDLAGDTIETATLQTGSHSGPKAPSAKQSPFVRFLKFSSGTEEEELILPRINDFMPQDKLPVRRAGILNYNG